MKVILIRSKVQAARSCNSCFAVVILVWLQPEDCCEHSTLTDRFVANIICNREGTCRDSAVCITTNLRAGSFEDRVSVRGSDFNRPDKFCAPQSLPFCGYRNFSPGATQRVVQVATETNLVTRLRLRISRFARLLPYLPS